MKTQDIINHINALEVKVYNAEAWNAAREMVINHLSIHHGLTDQYQWAFKTIELLKELEELKARSKNESANSSHNKPNL
jgi:hypothetical protein